MTVTSSAASILIAGGTGRLGSAAARLLLAGGRPVRILTRSAANAEALRQLGAQIAVGDVRDPASIAGACGGARALIAAVQALNGTGGNTPKTVDLLGNRHLIDAARDAGVDHFVLMSAAGADPHNPMEFFRLKYQTEEYLKSSGLRYTIVRATAFMEFWADLIGGPIATTGQATIFGRGINPVNFVSVEDVARFVVLALDNPRLHNRLIEVAGPENLSVEQVVQTFERVLERTARRKHVPLSIMRAMRVLVSPFNPALARQIHAGILMDTTDQRADASSLLAEFPTPLRRLEDVVRLRVAKPTPAVLDRPDEQLA